LDQEAGTVSFAAMQAKALPGFRDFYPEDFALRAHIFEAWRQVASRYGFEEYDGPPLESLDLYTAKSGDEIVGQLYNFIDKGERAVALRPEMTPSLARMVAARANALRKPVRWFSIPQLFRYERQQRGRLREHFQLNCDLIGESSPLADAEIIALAIDVMQALGLTAADVRVRVSDRQLLGALLQRHPQFEGDRLKVGFDVLDKIHRTEKASAVSRLETAGFGKEAIDLLFQVASLRTLEAVEGALAGNSNGADAGTRFGQTVRALQSMGLGDFIDVDLTIVRGLAYYTGVVFELFDARGELRAICGGGRYDNLVLALGGVDLPCIGFGMGDVVLGELLKDRGLIPPHRPSIDVFLAAIGEEDQPDLLRLAHQLRTAGLRVEYSLGAGAVGKQLKLADARNARLALVIGPDDRARGEVQVKDLSTKAQGSVRIDALVADLKRRIG
jgi:histidyl-tRNA synthetase